MVSASNPYFLPVADEALEEGYVELLRAGLAGKRLFVSLNRQVLEKPEQWGNVLAEITLNVAALYSADGELSEDEAIKAVTYRYGDFLRTYLASAGAEAKPVKSARPLGKTPAKKGKMPAKSPVKSKAPVKTPLKAKAKSASKAVAARKGARG
jgi:hypothetical protein